MTLLDRALLLATGLAATVLLYRFYRRYRSSKALYNVYYAMGALVLLVSGVLLLLLGYDVLASPYVLTIASLIPLGFSMGIAEQHYVSWKRAFKWFALVGMLAIAVTSIGGMVALRKIAVPLFHGGAGLVIIIGPFLARNAPGRFRWVGIGGLFISMGGVALAFISAGSQLLFFSPEFVRQILAGLLLLMSAAFVVGFSED